MWIVVAGFCGLQLWVLMGLLPATVGGLIAWIWAGLAAMTLAAGIVALRRHPDAGALLLGLVLPVTLIPPFVFGRAAVPLLARPLVQLLMGATLALGEVGIVLGRREELAPSPRRSVLDRAAEGGGHGNAAARLATLVLVAVWIALPIRALVDPTLLDGALGAGDPVRAKETLLLASFAATALIGLAIALPGAHPSGTERSPWPAVVTGVALAALWLLVRWIG